MVPIFEYVNPVKKIHSCLTATKLSDGQPILICGFENGSIQIFDLPAFKELGFLKGHNREAPIVRISGNMNGKIFAACLNGNLICYEIK